MWALILFVALYAPKSEDVMSTTENIRVTIEAGDAGFTFTVENKRDAAFRFCNWHTPLEGFYSDMLEVENSDGKLVEYLGIMMKRGEPTEEDYVTIAPGRSVSVQFTQAELAENYDISSKGSYSMRFVGSPRINGLPNSDKVKFEVR